LESIEDGGMPKDCFLSVRVGETQKLSRLAASRMYHFPKSGERRFGKIEVFRRIGTCNVDVDPSNKDLREVVINCMDAGFGTLGLKVSVTKDGKPDSTSEEVAPVEGKKEGSKVKAAKEYLSKHSLEVRLSEAMQAVLRERPEDPAEYLAAKLLETPPRVGGVKLPPLKGGKEASASEVMPRRPSVPEPVDEPQKLRPQKLQPLQKPLAPAPLAVPVPPAAETPRPPQPAPVVPHVGPDPTLRLYSEFTKAERPQHVPVKLHWRPSVGTWLMPRPCKRQEPAPLQLSKYKHTPSVGTWWMPRPRKNQEPAALQVMKFKHMPSVGTWVARAAPQVVQALVPIGNALLGSANEEGAAFRHLASVGTWLAPKRKGPSKLRSASPKEQEKNKAAWSHKPSVGTWLKKPAPAASVLAAKPSHLRPSVGTWLQYCPSWR